MPRMALAVLYAISLTLSISLFNFSVQMLIVSVIITCYFSFMMHNKNCFAALGGVTFAFFSVSFMYLWAAKAIPDFYVGFNVFTDFIFDSDTINTMWLLLISAGISLFSAIFVTKLGMALVVVPVGLLFFSVSSRIEGEYIVLPFIIYLFVSLLLTIKSFGKKSFKTQKSGKLKTVSSPINAGAFLAIPLCAAVILVSLVIAPAGEGISEFFHNPIFDGFRSISDKIGNLYVDSSFDLALTGFDGNGKLGGDVSKNNAPALNVKSNERMLYLGGARHNVYSKGGWSDSLSAESKPALNEVDLYDFEFAEWQEANEMRLLLESNFAFIRTSSVLVYPQRNFRIMFSPQGAITSSDRLITLTDSGIVRSNTFYGKGESYRMKFITQNIENIGKYLSDRNRRIELPGSRTEYVRMRVGETAGYYAAAAEASSSSTYSDRLKKLDAYAKNIYKNYLSLPENISERVRTLADNITKDIPKNNYYQKTIALRNSLLSYNYTLEPKLIPDGTEFVDGFLFESKEGYCSHFATALAVLCRTQGIPCRYVEGFVTPPQKDSDGIFHITNENAHSWVEAYFEGLGWVTVEATPPYREQYLESLKPEPRKETPQAQASIASESSEGQELEAQSETSSEPEVSSQEESQTSSESVSSEPPVSRKKSAGSRIIGYFIFITLFILAVSAAIILYAVFGHKKKLERISLLPNDRAIVEMFSLICIAARFDKNEKLDFETALQFGRKKENIYTYNGVSMYDITKIVTAAAYGKSSPEVFADRKIKVISFYNDMLSDIKKRRKIFNLFLLYWHVVSNR